MKKLFFFVSLIVYLPIMAQQGLFITSEEGMTNDGRITVTNGDFVSTSNTPLGGTLQMRGLDGDMHRIELGSKNNIDFLELYGTSQIELDGDLTLKRELLFVDSSTLNMAANSSITLQEGAEIVGESSTNTLTGEDRTFITTTDVHQAGITEDFGLIGVVVSNGATSMGATEVFRRYGTFEIAGSPTVERYYEVNPSVNSGLDLDVRFYLEDVDLNGMERNDLAAFRSTDGGTTFTNEGGTPNAFYHQVNNIEAFSIWAFADADLLGLSGNSIAGQIKLYPNPVNDRLSVSFAPKFDAKSYVIYTLLGEKVQEGNLTSADQVTDINVTNLAAGVYLIRLESGTMQSSYRFFKN